MFRVIEVPCELSPFFSDPETRTARRTPPRRWKRNRFGFFFPLYRLHRRHTHTHTHKNSTKQNNTSLSLSERFISVFYRNVGFFCVCVCVCVCMCTLSDVFFSIGCLSRQTELWSACHYGRSSLEAGVCSFLVPATSRWWTGGGALLGF